MPLNRAITRFAGVMVLLGVVRTVYVSHRLILFTTFIGANLIQSSFTGFCPPAILFKKLGAK